MISMRFTQPLSQTFRALCKTESTTLCHWHTHSECTTLCHWHTHSESTTLCHWHTHSGSTTLCHWHTHSERGVRQAAQLCAIDTHIQRAQLCCHTHSERTTLLARLHFCLSSSLPWRLYVFICLFVYMFIYLLFALMFFYAFFKICILTFLSKSSYSTDVLPGYWTGSCLVLLATHCAAFFELDNLTVVRQLMVSYIPVVK